MAIAVWYVVATLSVVERSHTNYVLFVAPLGVVLAYRWLGGSLEVRTRRFLFPVLLALGLVVLRPFDICRGFAAWLGKLEIPPTFERVTSPARAGGVLFKETDAHAVEMMRRTLAQVRLQPDQTWFDFANLPALYYLFDRDCPIRYYEVSFFQDFARQREVIAALDTNPKVRLAILPVSGSTAYAIDGIPNELRAQAVFEYLQLNFRPLLVDRDLQVWIRNDAASVAGGTLDPLRTRVQYRQPSIGVHLAAKYRNPTANEPGPAPSTQAGSATFRAQSVIVHPAQPMSFEPSEKK
jgi:hypothetical protein